MSGRRSFEQKTFNEHVKKWIKIYFYLLLYIDVIKVEFLSLQFAFRPSF
jgi:hypothetical protein